ncbi:MAG TPA: NADPH-dependent F420 reductase [Gemmatimonadaceae bacterium]|nr:NADPH-dependent F420 reductase [Gemmatimonadaceae bacterium]
MKIGIIGAGRMGRALGRRWARAGHEVTISFSRDPHKLEAIAREIGQGAKSSSPADAAKGAEAVLFAVQWSTVDEALEQARSLAGKTVLTCTIPMTADDTELAIGHTSSGAEELARRTGASVVAIFNTITSELLSDDAEVVRVRPDVVYCGDSEAAKETAAHLARDAGCNPIDAGGLRISRYLEPFGVLIAQLAYEQGLGETLGYRIVLPGSS